METQENGFKRDKIINEQLMARVKSGILLIAGAVIGMLTLVIFLERSGNIVDVDASSVSGAMIPLDASVSLVTVDSKPIAMRLVQGRADLSVYGDVVMVEICVNAVGEAEITLEYDHTQLSFQGAPWYRSLEKKVNVDGGNTDRLIFKQIGQYNYLLLFHNKSNSAPSLRLQVESTDSDTLVTMLRAPVAGALVWEDGVESK